MSLQLFANYENTFNSSIFYRLTSVTPYTFTLRLQDTNSYSSNSYIVEYTTDTNPNRILFDKNLTTQVRVSAQTPGVHWFSVTAFNDQDFTLYQVLSLSAVIVGSFLSADYIAYPQGFLTSTSPNYRYSSNYNSETAYLTALQAYQYGNIGNAFYGEGHTESVGLSARTLNAGCSAAWTVGPYSKITNNRTTYVIVTSQTNTAVVHPVSLQVFNNTFPLNSPTIAYFEQLSGTPSFYPYYASSLSVNGITQNPNNTTFRSSLSVLKYPKPNNSTDNYVVTASPAISGFIDLPFDSSGKLFSVYIAPPSYSDPVITQFYAGSQWSLNATANPASVSPDWSLTTTILSSTIHNFNFQLAYYNQDDITNALLRASIGYTTNFNLTAIAVKGVLISPASGSDRYNTGRDWIPRYDYIPYGFSTKINPLPVTNVYTPNYYNLTGTDVSFVNIWSNSSNKTTPIETVVIYNNLSSDPLSGGEQGSLYFGPETIGIVDLSAITTFQDLSSNTYITKYHNPGIFEVIDRYDDVETNHYHSEISPFSLTRNSIPRLSPNEWVTSDNVNNIIDTFLACFDEFNEYTSLYQNKAKLAGRLLQQQTLSGLSYTWIVPTIDPIAFTNWPTPSLTATDNYYVDMISLPQSEQIVFAYKNSLNLINNSYQSYISDTVLSLDQIFEFDNIQSVDISSDNYIAVLDSSYPKVSIYTIIDNKFNLFTTWGQFGVQQNKQGLNNPKSLHIDQNNLIWIADYGNECVKKFTINGKNLLTIASNYFVKNPPIGVCVDAEEKVHVLTQAGVYVFDSVGNYVFNYSLDNDVVNPVSINTSYNRECIYITYNSGVVKYFRTGTIYNYVIKDRILPDKSVLRGFNSIHQDQYRNLYITVADQVVKIADIMKLRRYKSLVSDQTLWTKEQLYVHREEYVQPWVYLKSFHRLWDNIELFRNSLFYNETGGRAYIPATYKKSDLVIGQNEIVTNAVINRLCSQLWTNLRSMTDYFRAGYTKTFITPTPTSTPTPTPTPTYTYTPAPTQTYTYTPGPTPTPTYPADGIVSLNDNSIYFVTNNDSTTFVVSGARIS